MSGILTPADIQNVSQDVLDVQTWANGDETYVQTFRLGEMVPSPAKLVFDVTLPNWRGPYSAIAVYAIGDAVEDLGSSYISIQAGSGNQPTYPTGDAFWDVMALKGLDGAGTVQTVTTAGGTGIAVSGTATDPIIDGINSSTTVKGVVELATNTETQTGTDSVRAVTPAGLASTTALTTRAGLVELATNTETQTGTDSVRAVTPAGLSSRVATVTQTGLVEKSTSVENLAGVAADKYPDVPGVKEMIDTFGGLVKTVSTQTGAVATGTTVIPKDDTIPQNTEGDEYMTRTITPTSATNNLEIEVVLQYSHSGGGQLGIIALFQDAIVGALATSWTMTPNVAGGSQQIILKHTMVAGTIALTTFKIRAGCEAAGTTTFNGVGGARLMGGVNASSITIKEVSP